MNKGGRPNKPKSQKLIEGTYRKDRDVSGLSMALLTEIPEPPDYLSDTAKQYFYNVCNTLIEYSLLTPADIFLVIQLSEALEIQQTAYENIKDGNSVQETKTGFQSTQGWYAVWEKTSKKIAELSNLFGMNPSAREKFNIKEKQTELNDLQKLLLGNGKQPKN